MALYEIMCVKLANCEVLQNLKSPSLKKKFKKGNKFKKALVILKFV